MTQPVPTFEMSCFFLPQSSIDKLRITISNFWSSSKQNITCLHWIAWDGICTSKNMGGTRISRSTWFQYKASYKTIMETNSISSSLLACVLKEKYYNHASPLEDRRMYSPSSKWQRNNYLSRVCRKPLDPVMIWGFGVSFRCQIQLLYHLDLPTTLSTECLIYYGFYHF